MGSTTADIATHAADPLGEARAARERVRDRCSNAQIIDAIVATAEDWLGNHNGLLSTTARELSEPLLLDEDMIRRGLQLTFAALNPDTFESLIREQAGEPQSLEPGASQGRRRGGPVAVVHMLAGNIPGLAIHPLAVSLLARTIAVVRDSSRQPLVTARFIQSMAEHDADLAAMLVSMNWDSATAPPGDVIASAQRVEIYGSDATVATITPTVKARDGVRDIVSRATRVSAAVVAIDADAGEAAAAIAHDAALYDGQGCLSPETVIVEGDSQRTDSLMEAIANELEHFEQRWPRRARELEIEVARRALIDSAELAELSGRGRLLTGDKLSWAVASSDAHGDETRIAARPGLRCLRIVRSPDREATLARLREAENPLAAVGYATTAETAAMDSMAADLRSTGAAIVCPAGLMQAPGIDRDPDGGLRLADLLGAPGAVSGSKEKE
jgi:acyl-CoA reductase-like NAD-dependent aldehyde dehydrogenase